MWSRTWLTQLAPGIGLLLGYQRQWWLPDLRAGLSVATVALPVAIAYAALAGVTPLAGLYSSILPLLIYALFGSSRQLIVGPDAATCAVLAAVVAAVIRLRTPSQPRHGRGSNCAAGCPMVMLPRSITGKPPASTGRKSPPGQALPGKGETAIGRPAAA